MNEIGIDISCQHSKKMDEHRGILSDQLPRFLDEAKGACPICRISLKAPAAASAAKKAIHKTFNDPAIAKGSEEERLNVFMQANDEIKSWIREIFQ